MGFFLPGRAPPRTEAVVTKMQGATIIRTNECSVCATEMNGIVCLLEPFSRVLAMDVVTRCVQSAPLFRNLGAALRSSSSKVKFSTQS
jgi:hypothetical protein